MSFARSARTLFAGRGVPGCTSAAPFLISLALMLPARATAQTPSTFPPLSFRQRFELQMLGEMSGDFAHAPSFRLTLQRRQTLMRSTILSGVALLDPLSNSVGLAVGQMLTFGAGSRLLEPFADVGVAYADARVPDGSYAVAGSGGAGPRVIQRYQIVQGPAALMGAGVSWSGLMHDRTSVRLTLGYWRLAGTEGFRRGSLRLGVSLGIAHRDPRWYALATDRTPPSAVVMGRDVAMSDSVEVADGRLRVLAADANGIARVEVNGNEVAFGPAGAIATRLPNADGTPVMAATGLRPAFGGQLLDVAVRDSAGLTTRSAVWAFRPPDHEPPVVSARSPSVDTAKLDPRFRAVADDSSGIADARIGVCPVGLVQPLPDTTDLGAVSVTTRLVDGWGMAGRALAVAVHDRAGNVAEAPLPSVAPEIPEDAAPPRLTDLTATVGSTASGRRSVRVRGAALDPAGGWIARVEVEGRPAVLRVGRYPSRIEFDGWLLVGSDAGAVSLAATTLDGRKVRASVPITAAASRNLGQLRTLLVLPEATDDRVTDLRALARKAGADDASILVGRDATPAAVRSALKRMQVRAGPDDVVLVHLEGTLAADQSATGPSVELASGGRFDLTQLDHAVRELDAATLFSAGFRPGRSWPVLPTTPPGVRPPPGCYQDDAYPAGAVIDAGSSTLERILTGLAGDADTDGDGRVLLTELSGYLGLSSGPGLSPIDPLLTVSVPGGTR